MRTKIVATIGPPSNTRERLKELAQAGVSIFRLNFSHGGAADFVDIIGHIRAIEAELNHPLTIMQDLSGPKIRLGAIREKTIQVSKGEEKVSVPDVRGTDENTAKNTLSGAGLNVTVTTDYSDSVAQGNVISQDPSGGTKVDAGTNVNIVVSLGSRPVSVPSVVGVSESNARQLIASAGLSVGTVTYREDSAPAGQVISCDPGVGTSVSRGTTVNLVVSQGQSSSGGETDEPDEPDTGEGQ